MAELVQGRKQITYRLFFLLFLNKIILNHLFFIKNILYVHIQNDIIRMVINIGSILSNAATCVHMKISVCLRRIPHHTRKNQARFNLIRFIEYYYANITLEHAVHVVGIIRISEMLKERRGVHQFRFG